MQMVNFFIGIAIFLGIVSIPFVLYEVAIIIREFYFCRKEKALKNQLQAEAERLAKLHEEKNEEIQKLIDKFNWYNRKITRTSEELKIGVKRISSIVQAYLDDFGIDFSLKFGHAPSFEVNRLYLTNKKLLTENIMLQHKFNEYLDTYCFWDKNCLAIFKIKKELKEKYQFDISYDPGHLISPDTVKEIIKGECSPY